jgi:hypothetical protein
MPTVKQQFCKVKSLDKMLSMDVNINARCISIDYMDSLKSLVKIARLLSKQTEFESLTLKCGQGRRDGRHETLDNKIIKSESKKP